jgi:Uma2 family endonuclease
MMPKPDMILGGDMSAAPKWSLVTIASYLEAERESPFKREFVGGLIYRRPDERNAHNRIATNTLGAFGILLRGTRHWPFNSDTKIRIRLPAHTRFYYPDVSVVCRPNPPHETFQDDPAMIVEVLSRKTRRIDQVEKKDAYLTIPSLNVYMLIEQEAPLVQVFRRTKAGFVREVYEGLDAVIPLEEIEIVLPLAEIYAGVEFVPEVR